MPARSSFFEQPYEEHTFGTSISPEVSGAYAGGVGRVGTPAMIEAYARLMHARPKTLEVKKRVAEKVLEQNGYGIFLALHAIEQWEKTAIYFDVTSAIDAHAESIADTLPSKARLAQDVYNLGANSELATDDRLRAFRLFGEIQGHITKGPQVSVHNDNRSIILVPRRSNRGDDPVHEAKVIEAQARLLTNAAKP